MKQETSWEHTCRDRYGQYHHGTPGFCVIQVLVRTLLCGRFWFLCQITTLLILAVFLLWLTCTTMTWFLHLLLSLSKWCLCPVNTASSWLTEECGLWKSHLAVHRCRGLLKFRVLGDNPFTWRFGSVNCASHTQTQRNCGMSKTWCLPSAITSQLGEVMSSSPITCILRIC